MNGIVINSGKNQRFRDDESKKHFKIEAVYDVYGNRRIDYKLPNGKEVEVVENENGTVTVLFSPE